MERPEPPCVLAGGTIVLPDRLITNGSLLVDGSRIAAVGTSVSAPPPARALDVRGCYVLPGFVDVHVHGVGGYDTLDQGDTLARIAALLPQYGVTAFCPTTVACAPDALRRLLDQVKAARQQPGRGSARVLPAHLESNFINPAFCGAQPASCLRSPLDVTRRAGSRRFSGGDILDVIAASRPEVGIVTLAPEIDGGLALVRDLVAAGHRVSLGHSGAGFEIANAAIDAGARHATHLFNRMPPLTHRAPGLAGAVLTRSEVAAELICDGRHVHPSFCQIAISAKGASRIMAITDGTAGSGLPEGSSARLGGRTVRVENGVAVLEDGTLAGSTLTMDGAFRMLAGPVGISMVAAAAICCTTPARELGQPDLGIIEPGAVADLVVLDGGLRVVRTFVNGEEVYSRPSASNGC